MALPQLSEGVLPRMFQGENVKDPVLQILAVKSITNQNGKRFRFLLSDGIHSCQLCIMVENQKMLESGELEKFAIIRLKQYSINKSNERTVLIIAEPECLVKGADVRKRIGDPQNWDVSEAQPTVATATTASQNDFQSARTESVTLNSSRRNGYQAENSRRDSFGFSGMNMDDQVIDEKLIIPIQSITPYNNKWAIRGRCTNKTPKRHWSNAKGEGHLFSFTLQDDTGEIRITAFKMECDRFYDLVQVDKVYLLSKAIAKPANKRFSGENHDYELTLGSDSVLKVGDESDASCPKIKFNFINIKEIEAVPPDTLIDVVGIVRDPGVVSTINSVKTNKEYKKRDISLVDSSNAEIKLTLWHSEAENFSGEVGSVLICKKVKVSDYSGRTLSTVNSSLLMLDPDVAEAQRLKGWWIKNGGVVNPTQLSARPGEGGDAPCDYLNSISKEAVSMAPNQTKSITAKATIIQAGRFIIYQACPTCNKKLTDLQNGFLKCDKCRDEQATGNPRMIYNVCLSDCTGGVWASIFNDDAEKLLGREAKELDQLRQINEDEFQEVQTSPIFRTYDFRLRCKMETWKEETRVRYTVFGFTEINPVEYGKRLLNEIRALATA
ncbi:replication protein A 70 kDa DNA-binding subunit-like [Brevipalpus obovatus]|uniref:replication protein A 70 kDa DNA-binding subunit-like n=1 Tax=Brevipalpus obovatus TaxID=246614 RepID=UPI003D9F10FC